MNLLNILNTLDKYNNHQFDINIDEQIGYMSSLGTPMDDIDRSYKQYLCQNFFSPWWVRFIWFSISVFGIPIMLCALFCKRKMCYITKIKRTHQGEKKFWHKYCL
jgi:hypothetical protein